MIEIFYDVGATFIAPEDNKPLQVVLPSDATIQIPYAEQSQVHFGYGWQTLCPRNVVDTRRVPLMTISRSDADFDVMTSEWLDIEELARLARSGVTAAAPRGRNIFRHTSRLASSSRTGQIWGVGSKGCLEVWIDNQTPDATRRLNVVTLHSPSHDSAAGGDMSGFYKQLPISIAVDRIADILTFCDEAATLAVLADACDAGCCPPSVRFFEY